jgi:hypothetical protein
VVVHQVKNMISVLAIVVSASRDGTGSVFQYGLHKIVQGQSFCLAGFLNQPPSTYHQWTAVSGLKAQYEWKGHRLEEAIDSILERIRMRRKYKQPDPGYAVHKLPWKLR